MTEDRIKSDELIKSYEQVRIRLQTELDVLKRDLDERNRDLKRERLRIETFIRQEENSQSKQNQITKSYEDLSEECRLLKNQVIELESQRDQLQKINHTISQEVTSLQTNITQLHQQIDGFQSSQNSSCKYLEEILSFKDNLFFLVSDKFVNEMQNQMKIHEQRIDLLQKENNSLKISLEKLLIPKNPPIVTEDSYRQYSQMNETIKSKPSPLFLLNSEIIEKQQTFTEPTYENNNTNQYIQDRPVITTTTKSDTELRRPLTSMIPQVSVHEVILGLLL